MRLIDADALSEELSTLATTITGLRAGKGVLREYMIEYRKSVLRIVDEQPTVDSAPVVHGRWFRTGAENVYGGIEIQCSECGHTLMTSPGHIEEEHYCCKCGAKMDRKDDK